MKSSRSHKKQRSSKSSSSRHSQKELPRKAAKIRRTFPEPGVEKTELRFVVYNEPGGKYRREQFLHQVADFFQEQAKRLADGEQQLMEPIVKEEEMIGPIVKRSESCIKEPKCTKVCPKFEAECEPGIILVKDVIERQAPHHESTCKRARAIRTSLPVIKKLIERVCELHSYQKNNQELIDIHKTAQEVYDDATHCLAKGGPVGDHICDRVMRLQQVASKILMDASTRRCKEKKTTRVRTVFSSSSFSNTDSQADSAAQMRPSGRRQ